MYHENFGNMDIHQDQNGNLTGTTTDMGNGTHLHTDANGNPIGHDSDFGNQHQDYDKDGILVSTTVHSPFRKKYLSMEEDGNLHHHPSFTVEHHETSMPHFDSGISDSSFHDFRSDLLNQIR